MKRLKLPAYGKRLLEERRAGKHPLEVTVVYGDRGFDVAEPKLWIKPEEFEPGKFDFHVLAGLRAIVMDQLGESAAFDQDARPPTFGKFYDLLGEVAAFAAPVAVYFPDQWNWEAREVQGLVRDFKWYDHNAHASQWPRWWNDALDQSYDRRMCGWFMDVAVKRGLIERDGRAA